ncbi:PhzF family phenazine biosynthesis protein [Flagellatimonas centrodinii]|uniref:PhzF family phenazine biosynthesis protein n=1 Tax=Flagellatimonas centrodinii TaxID=2806210 RepID=UPI001FEF2CC1|nr:PhzF family phenazine biosynthesis protein [Flagellatimonas centrodinii]ULQ46635.1 PhzF family phenazine biosynthesis protein [Flagellatimonas centrodinii]
MRLTLIDVFAEQRYAGNQLAVVQDAAGLADDEMQAIAREMNFSETTFVLAESPGEATVRIFTPTQELPFAGHPTLGTAWVLTEGRGTISLQLPMGPVPVRFDAATGIGWLQPPAPQLGTIFDVHQAAALLGLSTGDLHPQLPPQLLQLGPAFLFVPLRGPAALQQARLDADRHDTLLAAGVPAFGVFLFSETDAGADTDYRARMFFRTPEVREDPATGSANAALAGYLRHHLGRPISVTVEQGTEIQRPSRIYVRADAEIAVGGRVQCVMRGKLTR